LNLFFFFVLVVLALTVVALLFLLGALELSWSHFIGQSGSAVNTNLH